jgi:hypothetical protein
LRKNLVYGGAATLIFGLILAALTQGTHEVKLQSLSIEKKDGYSVYISPLRAGEEFAAEFVCHKPEGRLRMALMTASWYSKWRSGEDVPSEQLLGDAYGHQGRIAWTAQADDTYGLVLVPINETSSWPFEVSVRLELKSGRGIGWYIGVLLILCGIAMTTFGLLKKSRSRHSGSRRNYVGSRRGSITAH